MIGLKKLKRIVNYLKKENNMAVKKQNPNKPTNEQIKQAAMHFEMFARGLDNYRSSGYFRETEETVIRISGYTERRGFRLVTKSLPSKEVANDFYKAFLKEINTQYPTMVLLNCTRFERDNHLEFLVVSRYLV